MRPDVINALGDVHKLFYTKGEGGSPREIWCKLFRLEIYSKRGKGVKNLENMQTKLMNVPLACVSC